MADGSRNSSDRAQLLEFMRGIDDNLNAFEELACLQSMEGRTTGKISRAKLLIALLPNYTGCLKSKYTLQNLNNNLMAYSNLSKVYKNIL